VPPSGFTATDLPIASCSVAGALSHRAQALESIYNLRALPLEGKPKRDFELLQYLGIVRPVMLKRLVDIRNLVEHEDADSPNIDDCRMLAEFVWYFLRSTDSIVMSVKTHIEYARPQAADDMTGVTVEYNPPHSYMVT